MAMFLGDGVFERHWPREYSTDFVLCLTFAITISVLLALCWWTERLLQQSQRSNHDPTEQRHHSEVSASTALTNIRPQNPVTGMNLQLEEIRSQDQYLAVATATDKTSCLPALLVQPPRRHRRLVDRSPPIEFVAGSPPNLDLSGARELPVPPKLHCKLIITTDGSSNGIEEHVHHKMFLIEWQRASSFGTCVRAVEGFLKKIGGPSNLYYKSSWQYRIMKQQRQDNSDTYAARRLREMQKNKTSRRHQEVEVYAESIEKNAEWREQLPHNLAGILHADRDATFFLELNFSYTRYSPHQISSCSGQGCLAAIRATLFDRRIQIENSPFQSWFVPGKFIHSYFTLELIDHIVERDEKLGADPAWKEMPSKQKTAFVEDVSLFCTRLLATSIYANLDMRCVFHLWRNKKKDVNIPLLTKHKALLPHDVDPGFFDTFIRCQGSFKAHSFPDPSNEHVLPAVDDDQNTPSEHNPDLSFEQAPTDIHHSTEAPSKHENIHPCIVAPIIEQWFIGQGNNAEVYKVRVHVDHHKFSPNRGKLFALKRIVRSSTSRNLHHESEILQKLDRAPHPHLTPLIASWSQGDCCSILLPLASGNLHDFLRRGPRPVLDGTFVLWLLRQMTGLAAGLDHIHNLGPADLGPANEVTKGNGNRSNSGYHHDLHPKNILIFDDDTLKISDFGTARLQQVLGSGLTNSGSYQTRRVLCCHDYEAPDWTLTEKASRPHDVWALGCIFLEMLVWASGKDGEIDKFHGERLWADETKNQQIRDASFWYVHNHQGRLKSAVKKRLTSMKQRYEGKFVFKTLVKLIGGMLCIEADPNVPGSRLQIAIVRSTLEKQIRQAELDLRGNPNFFLEQSTGKCPPAMYAPPSSIVGRGCSTPSELGAAEQDQNNRHLAPPITPQARRYSTSDLQTLRITAPDIPRNYLPAAPDQQSDLARTGEHFQSLNGHEEDAMMLPDTPTIVIETEASSKSPASPAFRSDKPHDALAAAIGASTSQRWQQSIDQRSLLPPVGYSNVSTWSRSVSERAGRRASPQHGVEPPH